LPVVCNAEVEAPVGRAEDTTFTFWLPALSTDIAVRLPEPLTPPTSVADVGAVAPSSPTEGFVADIEPVIGSGFVGDTGVKLPELFTKPISVLEVGAVVPLGPTEGFELAEDKDAGYRI
jgi:hypothetical protein